MAKDWIKMRVDLADDPAVISIAAALRMDEDLVVGKLHRLWSWADGNTTDGVVPGVGESWIDRKVSRKGFAAAMCAAGWLIITAASVTFPHFDRHNGASAKRRSEDAKRKRELRDENPDSPPDSSEKCPHDLRTNRGPIPDVLRTREEKRREEKNSECLGTSSSEGIGVPENPPPTAEYGRTEWATATDPPIPPPLDLVTGFTVAWTAYVEHVDGKGKPMTKSQARRLLGKLSFDGEDATACLEHSIDRGWIKVKGFAEVKSDRAREESKAESEPRRPLKPFPSKGETQDAETIRLMAAMAARKEAENAGSETGRAELAIAG